LPKELTPSPGYARGAWSLPLRLIYFVLIGWWLTWLWINLAWLANLSVIGCPWAHWMLNRVPQVLLMRPPSRFAAVNRPRHNIIVWRVAAVPQRPWPWRLCYLLLVGWWASLIWANVAWLLCVTILGSPFGILMLTSLPSIATLLRLE